MKQATFGNFQIGMLDNPSVEDKGGFEFAAGMDIFSEPGVMKAAPALVPVTLGTGASLTALPSLFVDTAYDGGVRGYVAVGAKILESQNGTDWTLFLTNSRGSNVGLGIWAGYLMYAADNKLGRTLIGNASGRDDVFADLETDAEAHLMVGQGGTLKIGNSRYVASLNEAFSLTAQALKLPAEYRASCLSNFLTRLFVGTKNGNLPDASVFDWRGTVLSSGSALPDNSYPIKLSGMNALGSDGQSLYAFPDNQGQVLAFDGVRFVPYKTLFYIAKNASLTVHQGAVSQDATAVLFSGLMNHLPGVFQMKDGAVCQSLVPSMVEPGSSDMVNIGLVRTAFGGKTFVGYSKEDSYRLEVTGTSRRNNAIIKTAYHRINTDKSKRWGGVKLNLKPLANGTAVDVSFRTQRDAAFTSTGITITSANQDKPLLFKVQPRSRELQLQFKYTTSGANSPELLTYDLLYEILSSNRW